eukprot:XP_001692719.1 predicted protein [Chlamydomonas reinhardtii]
MQVYGYEVVGWEEAHAKEPKLPAADPYAPSQLVTPLDSQQQQQQQQQPPPPSAASKASPLGVPRHGQRTIFNVEVRRPSSFASAAEQQQHQLAVLRADCELVIIQRAEAAQGPPAPEEHTSAGAAAARGPAAGGAEAAEAAAPVPCDEVVTLVPAFFFCCSSGGRVTVRLRPGRDGYVAGEAAEVVVEVDNRSNQEFRDVRLEVERRLTLVSNSAGGGGSAGSSGSGSSSATAGLVPGCFTEEERIFKSKTTACYLGANALRLPVPLPSNTPPSTSGALVRCSYTATVEVLPASATALRGAAPPRLRVPLTVFASAPSSFATAAARHAHLQQDASEQAPAHVLVVVPPVDVVLPAAAPQLPPTAEVNVKQHNGVAGANPMYAGP